MPSKLAFCMSLLFIAAITLLIAGCGTFLPGNHPPRIDRLLVNGLAVYSQDPNAPGNPPTVTVATNSKVVVTCLAEDPDSDPLTYTWTDNVTASGTPTSFATFTAAAEGKSTVTCTVQDGRDGADSRSVVLQVVNPGVNHAPAASLSPGAFQVAPGGAQTLACTATDADNDKLSFTFYAIHGTVVQSASDPTMAVYTAPSAPTQDTIFCVVTDSKGASTPALATATVK